MFIQVKKNPQQQNIFINKGGQTSSASILKLGLVLQQEGSQVLNGVWWSGTKGKQINDDNQTSHQQSSVQSRS